MNYRRVSLALAQPTVRPLSPFLRGEGWGEGQPHGECPRRDLYPLTRIASCELKLSRSALLGVCDSVMPGLVPGIHVCPGVLNDVDGRDKPGHDDVEADE